MVSCATLGPLGNFKAPGTVATCITLFFIIGLSWLNVSLYAYGVFLIAITLFSLCIVSKAIRAFPGDHDPRSIVIDEVVGTLFTFYNVPLNIGMVCIGFIVFRLLDIYKPLGIAMVERCNDAFGIVFDDIVAGIIANFVVRFVYAYLF
jgi:phosphatidylglycerophosphatase A